MEADRNWICYDWIFIWSVQYIYIIDARVIYFLNYVQMMTCGNTTSHLKLIFEMKLHIL